MGVNNDGLLKIDWSSQAWQKILHRTCPAFIAQGKSISQGQQWPTREARDDEFIVAGQWKEVDMFS